MATADCDGVLISIDWLQHMVLQPDMNCYSDTTYRGRGGGIFMVIFQCGVSTGESRNCFKTVIVDQLTNNWPIENGPHPVLRLIAGATIIIKLHLLSQYLSRCPRQLRELAYFTLGRSGVEYGAVVWDPYLSKDIRAVEAVQRKAARFVTANRHRASVTDMINTLGWDTLKSRREKSRMKYMNTSR